MNHTSFYKDLLQAFCQRLVSEAPGTTQEVTNAIKAFFRNYCQPPRMVLCRHEACSEYMIDVLVTSFDPKKAVERKTLRVLPTSVDVHLAVESEIGGESASSAYGVMKNVVEDYLKLLIVRAEYRVMIFTSLAYTGEKEHVLNRVETLRDLYSRASGVTSGMLLIHLAGSQPCSTQVQVSVAAGTIRGFVISPDGSVAEELPVTDELPVEGSSRDTST